MPDEQPDAGSRSEPDASAGIGARALIESAETRWARMLAERPDLAPAVALQRALLTGMIDAASRLAGDPAAAGRLDAAETAARLSAGQPVLCDEPPFVPIAVLEPLLIDCCDRLASAGAAEAAGHIAALLRDHEIEPAALIAASLRRDQEGIRLAAAHHGLSADLLWLVGEIAAAPLAYLRQRSRLGSPSVVEALAAWPHGSCPACGSWPAVAEFVAGRRTLRCSFCAADWQPASDACPYCGEAGESWVTAAPDPDRPGRRLELCGECRGYLKSVEVDRATPFPLLAIDDMATMDLDVYAMDRGYHRPPLPARARACGGTAS